MNSKKWSIVNSAGDIYPKFNKEIVNEYHKGYYAMNVYEIEYVFSGVNIDEFLMLCDYHELLVGSESDINSFKLNAISNYKGTIKMGLDIFSCKSLIMGNKNIKLSTILKLNELNIKLSEVVQFRLYDEKFHKLIHEYLYEKEKYIHKTIYFELFNALKLSNIIERLTAHEYINFCFGEEYRNDYLDEIINIRRSLLTNIASVGLTGEIF